ncbi:MAG TPA: NAD(P)-dependent oxidoreductase [Devosia sp.]
MKIALTGSSGRIGQGIIRAARERGHDLMLIDRVAPPEGQEPLPFILAEATEYEALVAAFAGCDALIHMAAIPSPGRHPDHIVHNNNVVGSYNALRAAAENGIMRICQASSVNAIGHAFSRRPRYDYFPIDENHPNYSEEPYSLSKWICEAQADAFARRFEDMSIASMRFHFVAPVIEQAIAVYANYTEYDKFLWAWTQLDAAADACLLSIEKPIPGHEPYYIVSPTTTSKTPSLQLAAEHFPHVPVTGDLTDHKGFFNSAKAERLLGWKHPVILG